MRIKSDKKGKWIPVVVYFNEDYLNDMLEEPLVEGVDNMPTEFFNKMVSNLREAKEDLQKGFDTTTIEYLKVLKYGISDIG